MALQEIRETKVGATQQSLALEELGEVPALDMAKRRRTSQDNDLLFNETSFPLNLSENVPAYSTIPSVAPIPSISWQSTLPKETMGSWVVSGVCHLDPSRFHSRTSMECPSTAHPTCPRRSPRLHLHFLDPNSTKVTLPSSQRLGRGLIPQASHPVICNLFCPFGLFRHTE